MFATIFGLILDLDTGKVTYANAGHNPSIILSVEPRDKNLVLDLTGLEYISSSGVRQIFAAHKKAKGNMVIRNTPANIFKVFTTTGIDKRVNFE